MSGKRQDRQTHGYMDYAIENFRPSENVENRARRGFNGTAQQWAIKTDMAERELKRFEDSAPYTEDDIANWLNTSRYRGREPYDLDGEIYKTKLARAAGVTEAPVGPVDTGRAYPGITEELYPKLHVEEMQPITHGYMDYNGGKEPFAGGGRVEDRRDHPGDYTLGGYLEAMLGMPIPEPLPAIASILRGQRDEFGIDPHVDRILTEERQRQDSQTPPVHRPRSTWSPGRYFVGSGDDWEYNSKGGDTPAAGGLETATPSGYRSGKSGYAGGGIVRRLSGALSTIDRQIPGKPSIVKIPGYGEVAAEPIKEVTEAADSYMRKVGRPGAHEVPEYEPFDEDRAARIAEAFERMQHNPADPETKRAYDAMISETLDQYESLKDAGVDFRFLKDGMDDPYAKSPALGYADTIENGRLWVFPTDQGFGTINEIADNPLLKRVGKIGDLENATANDAFRAVHDMYGHFGPGNPFFRHQGEERAWVNHSKMYSDDALPAMTSETRGQNSWLNFGPHGEHNRTALGADTVFADQKIGLLPSWAYGKEYATGGMVSAMAAHEDDDLVEPAMFMGKFARGARGILKPEAKRHLKAIGPDTHPDVARGIEEHVWDRHGVGMNRDRQPMFEVDDSGARLKDLPDFGPAREDYPDYPSYSAASREWEAAGGKPPSNMVLSDVLEHDELYDRLPELESLPLRMKLMDPGHHGLMDMTPWYGREGQNNYMQINRRLEEGDMLDTILHETQHAVSNKEGWTPGTNTDAASFLLGKQQRDNVKLVRLQLAHEAQKLGGSISPLHLGVLPQFQGASINDITQIWDEASKISANDLMRLKEDNQIKRRIFDDAHSIYERNEGESLARLTANSRELTAPERRESFWRDREDRHGEPRFVGPDARIVE